MKRLAAVLTAAALVLTGCSSSGSAKKTSSSAPAPSTSAARTVAPAALKAKLASLTSLTSVHIEATTAVAGQQIAGKGVARLADGAILAGDLTQALPGGLGEIRVIRAQGKTYAKLPSGLQKTSKLWLLLTANSTNPVVAQLAAVVSTILAVASPSSLVSFADAATTVRDLGGGHYAMSVDAAKLPPALSSGLGAKGTIPIDLVLDAQNRPVKVSGTFSLAGESLTPTIALSDFNQPVTVTAPPPAQVGTQ